MSADWPPSPSRTAYAAALAVVGIVLAAICYRYPIKTGPKSPAQPATTRAILPTTNRAGTATQPVADSPQSYIHLLRQHYAELPTTQPLSHPLHWHYAGHFVIPHPVYLDRRGCLWITHPAAPPAGEVLSGSLTPQVFFVREAVKFVHWSTTSDGNAQAQLICPAATGRGLDLVDASGRRGIDPAGQYDWSRACSWESRIVTTSATGAAVFNINGKIEELASPPLMEKSPQAAAVQMAFLDGPIAWIPPQAGHPGSDGVVSFGDGHWTRLRSEQGWPASLLHLAPLLDGSVLQLVANGPKVRLALAPLQSADPALDKKINELIGQLSDVDPNVRQEAYLQLTRFGPGLWPIAQATLPKADPETAARLNDLLKARISPLLGDKQLVDGVLQLVCRDREGGALFYSQTGVRVPRGQQPAATVAPAWLTIRPGRFVDLLPSELARQLPTPPCLVTPAPGGWMVTGPTGGPQLYAGAGALIAMLRPDEMEFSTFVGADQQGRYLFTKPGDEATTLIIDRYMPDPRPRLPAWSHVYPEGKVGWDKHGYPAARQAGAWALGTSEWRPIDEKTEPFITELPAPLIPATTQAEPPLLTDLSGNRYYDGQMSLRVVRADGTEIQWPLPALAAGDGECPPHLVTTPNGRIFLYNRPGQIVRLKPTPGEAEPFAVEDVFTRRIPRSKTLTRMWLDPAGRICLVYEGNKLTMLFPQGFIPPETALLIPGGDTEEDE